MNPLCRITLLGELSVQQADRVITRFRSQKAGALLAYLAYHVRQAHDREQLIELLWPHLDPTAGRSNLSFVLSSLRHQLEPPDVAAGAVLVADRHSVRINPAAITTDAAEFEAGMRLFDPARGDAEQIHRLEDTLALYRGPLLPGSYEDWTGTERLRLADLYVNAVRQLIRLLAQAGDLPRALDYAQRAVGVDPLREEVHRDLMRLYEQLGQPSMALQQYDRLERLLRQEMRENPSASTQRLVREIRSREQQAESSAIPPPADTTDHALLQKIPPLPSVPPDRSERSTSVPSGTLTLLLIEARSAQAGQDRVSASSHKAMAEIQVIIRRELEKQGGYVFEQAGGVVGGAFQSASEALACAMAVQQILGRLPEAEQAGAYSVRIALHTGDVAANEWRRRGPVREQATRLLSAGHDGQILCSEATAILLRPEGRPTHLGLYRLQNVPTPEHIFQVESLDGKPRTFPPLHAEAGYTSHLPLPFTRFFGQEDLLARLEALLVQKETRLVTLTGTGGIGKTRLSIEAARRLIEVFSGDVWFVPLADIRPASGLLSALVEALNLPRSGSLQPLEQVRERLSRQRCLLVLDNFEHLLETEASTLLRLLQEAATLACLVTSRQRLELPGEHEIPVLPLTTPTRGAAPEQIRLVESVQLFVDRAQAVKPDFQWTVGNRSALETLCVRLEGIPLAVELAASRAHVLTPTQMLAQLERRFDFLKSRRRDLPERHRTLWAAVDWSYQLLPPELQRFFPRLSVFRGGWSLEAAEAVCAESDPGMALDYLAQLRECSLVTADEDSTAMRMRFRMLETLREYAQEKLAPEERAALERRHAELFLTLAEEAEPGMRGPDQAAWLDRLESEHDNLRAALAWSLDDANGAEVGLQLAGALWRFWMVRGYYREGRAHLEKALSRAPSPHLAHALAGAFRGAAILSWHENDFVAARSYCLQSLAICQEFQASPQRLADVLYTLGAILTSMGDYTEARSCFKRSLRCYHSVKDRSGIANTINNRANVDYREGKYKAAAALYKRSQKMRSEAGDQRGVALSFYNLAAVACRLKDYETADLHIRKSLAFYNKVGDKRGIANAFTLVASIAANRRQARQAALLWGAAEALRESIGSPFPPHERVVYDREVAAVSATLGTAFPTAWQEGRAMRLEQAMEQAFETSSVQRA